MCYRVLGLILTASLVGSTLHAGTYAYVGLESSYGTTVSVMNSSTKIFTQQVPTKANPVGIVLSPDIRTLYVITQENSYFKGSTNALIIADAVTGKDIATVALPAMPIGIGTAPSGEAVYIAAAKQNQDAYLLTMNTQTSALSKSVAYPGPIAEVGKPPIVSADGSRLYSLALQGIIDVFDLKPTAAYIGNVTPADTYSADIALTPDGKTLIVPQSSLSTGQIQYIDTRSLEPTRTVPMPMSLINGVAVSPDGSELYIAAYTGEVNSILWTLNVASGTLNSGVAITLNYLSSVMRISPDGNAVYIADEITANVVAYGTKTETVSYLGTLTVVQGIAISNDSQQIFLANSNAYPVDVIDVDSQTVVDTVAAGDVAGAIVKAPNGKLFVLNANSANLALVNEDTAATLSAQVLKSSEYSVFTGALAKAGLFFADKEDLYVLNAQTDAVQELVLPSNGCSSLVNGLAAAPDGSRVFATTFNNGTCVPPDLRVLPNSQIPTSSLNVYDGSTGYLLDQVALNNPDALVVSPKGDFAWIVTSDSHSLLALTVVSLITLKPVAEYPLPTAGSLNSLAMTPNGDFIYATDSERALVHVIATRSGQEVAMVSAGVKPNEIAISADGTSAFVTDQGSTAVTEISTASNTVSGTIEVGGASRPVVFVER